MSFLIGGTVIVALVLLIIVGCSTLVFCMWIALDARKIIKSSKQMARVLDEVIKTYEEYVPPEVIRKAHEDVNFSSIVVLMQVRSRRKKESDRPEKRPPRPESKGY